VVVNVSYGWWFWISFTILISWAVWYSERDGGVNEDVFKKGDS